MKPEERFWPKVDRSGDCWQWLGYISTGGYGRFAKGHREEVAAHRFAYELMVGPIPAGLTLDHLCHTPDCTAGDQCPHRSCVNPAHLEPVTVRVNTLRGGTIPAANAEKTHCKHDHPLDGDNLIVDKHGHRRCRTCVRRRQLAYWHRRKGANA